MAICKCHTVSHTYVGNQNWIHISPDSFSACNKESGHETISTPLLHLYSSEVYTQKSQKLSVQVTAHLQLELHFIPVIVSMFQSKLSIKKLTILESQHQSMHHTVMVSFGTGAWLLQQDWTEDQLAWGLLPAGQPHWAAEISKDDSFNCSSISGGCRISWRGVLLQYHEYRAQKFLKPHPLLIKTTPISDCFRERILALPVS